LQKNYEFKLFVFCVSTFQARRCVYPLPKLRAGADGSNRTVRPTCRCLLRDYTNLHIPSLLCQVIQNACNCTFFWVKFQKCCRCFSRVHLATANWYHLTQ
jgi:hypothetical protein